MILVILLVALLHQDKIVSWIQVLSAILDGQAHLLLLDGKVHLPNLDGDHRQHPCPLKQPDSKAKMILVIILVEPHLLSQDLSLSHPVKIVLQI
jgi:hypothetical protein